MQSDSQERWKRRPDGSNWGDFGPDDALGTLNFLTPDAIRRARDEIREGRIFCLSLPLDRPGRPALNPRRKPPVIRPTMRGGEPNYNFELAKSQPGSTDIISDDRVDLYCQYSTQWDALAHGGSLFDGEGTGPARATYYNGFRAADDVRVTADGDGGFTSSAGPLGIDVMALNGVTGRGVLLDLVRHFGPQRRRVSYADIRLVIEKDDIAIRPGDIVCLHTGYTGRILAMGDETDVDELNAHAIELDGRDPALLAWLTKSRIAALAADNYAVEALPATPVAPPAAAAPLHEHCLFKLGMPLGELWLLDDLASWLADNGRHAFFLSAAPLRLPGAAGSPVTPIGIV